jgi:Na+/melibiose symporter-like transporter
MSRPTNRSPGDDDDRPRDPYGAGGLDQTVPLVSQPIATALTLQPPPHSADAESEPQPDAEGVLAVLRNRRFAALWLAQLATQVGGNMVLFGLTVLVFSLTRSNSAVSLLILTFLVPAVIFSAIAGVYVDNLDRRLILVVTNLLRAVAFVGMFLVDGQLAFIYLLNIAVSTVTTFFAPAEAAMIPIVVDRRQLLPANGLFTFTLQASFALGFAILGPLVVNLAGVQALLLFVAVLYLGAAALCWTLPSYAPSVRLRGVAAIGEAEHAVVSTIGQLKGGLSYIRQNRSIFWSLSYLAITASLIGVLGVLGPDFAYNALGLREQDFVVVVLPLGAGLVIGILLLNVYGRFLARRRAIEGGLIGLAISLIVLSVAGPISRFLQARAERGFVDLGPLVSLLAIVVLIAAATGISYAFVAVPAQTQLQEELPEDVRGRVFGVLNMLVSLASFLPIVIVGPVADAVGTPPVIFGAGVMVGVFGVASIFFAHPLTSASAMPGPTHAPVDPVSVATVPLARSDPTTLPRQFDGEGRSREPVDRD